MKMRSRLMAGMLLACAAMGCAMPIWSPNPDVRARQLIYQSESLRHIPEIWERIWMLDQPDQVEALPRLRVRHNFHGSHLRV